MTGPLDLSTSRVDTRTRARRMGFPSLTWVTRAIQLLTNGTWKKVGTDKTTGVGDYRVNIPDKSGKYRASVKKQTPNSGSDTCSAATSTTVTHH